MLKHYVSTRVRAAGQIVAIHTNRATPGNRDAVLTVDAGDGTTVDVPVGDLYMSKFNPAPGGYFLQYLDDGYESYCPAEVFERGGFVEVEEVVEAANAGSDNGGSESADESEEAGDSDEG